MLSKTITPRYIYLLALLPIVAADDDDEDPDKALNKAIADAVIALVSLILFSCLYYYAFWRHSKCCSCCCCCKPSQPGPDTNQVAIELGPSIEGAAPVYTTGLDELESQGAAMHTTALPNVHYMYPQPPDYNVQEHTSV